VLVEDQRNLTHPFSLRLQCRLFHRPIVVCFCFVFEESTRRQGHTGMLSVIAFVSLHDKKKSYSLLLDVASASAQSPLSMLVQ